MHGANVIGVTRRSTKDRTTPGMEITERFGKESELCGLNIHEK